MLTVWPPDARNRIVEASQKGPRSVPELLDRLKTALSDRYAIERELGSGGMATGDEGSARTST